MRAPGLLLKLLTTLHVILFALAVPAAEPIAPFEVADPEGQQYYGATGVGVPAAPASTTFSTTDRDLANFTSFTGGPLSVVEGSVTFTIAPNRTERLGWGNADGTQAPADQWTMPEEMAHVVLRIRKDTPGSSQVIMRYTRYGKVIRCRFGESVETSLEGTGWQDLRFEQPGYYMTYGAPADGLRFEISNPSEQPATYRVEGIRIEQPRRQAWIRHEFTLPDEPILRASAQVSGMNYVRWYRRAVVKQELWINGQKVDRVGDLYYMRTGLVDIRPYLKPGRNVIGMYGQGVLEPPLLYIDALVVQPGSQHVVRTGSGRWMFHRDAGEGWSTPEYDTQSWQPIDERSASRAVEGLEGEPGEPYYWRGPDLSFPVYDGSLPIPDWLGLLRLENGSGADKLCFRSDQPATVHAIVPATIDAIGSSLEFTLHRTQPDGSNGEPVLAQRITEATRNDATATLTFAMPLGTLPSGVYALTTRLRTADGEVLESRPREPLLVISRIEQTSMLGTDPYDALTLDPTESLYIDFTDPSHAPGRDWVETIQGRNSRDLPKEVETWEQTAVKTLNGEQYRETVGTTRGSAFSYRFAGSPDGPLKYTPGEFYLFELTYPDDAMRHMEVSVSSTVAGLWNNSQAGVGLDTGEKYRNTGQMQTLRWIHVADPGVHSIDVINAQETRHTTPEPRHAAAKSIRITRIVGTLPAAPIGSRREFGIQSERTAPNSGVGKNFGVETPDDDSGSLIARMIRMLQQHQAACDRYVQYLRFAGQNTHVIGMWQYHDTNTPYKRTNDQADGRVDPTLRNVLARTLDANGIGFYAGLEVSQLSNLNTAVTDAQVAVGTRGGALPGNDTVMMVDRDGRQFDANQLFTYTQNWMHPVIRAGYEDLVRDVTMKFDDMSNFRGIHFQLSWAQRSEYYIPGFSWRERADDPLVYSFDDVTFERFRDDTGINIAVGSSDPQRFSQRYQAVSSGPHRSTFMAWRNAQLKAFLEGCVAAMKQVDDELVWVNLLNIDEVDFYRVWEGWLAERFDGDGNPLAIFLREYGLDLPMLNSLDDMTVGRSAMGWREMPNSHDTGLSIFGQQNPYHWWARTDERIADAFDDDSDDLRYVLIRNSWDENVLVGAADLPRGASHFRSGDEEAFIGGEKDWVMYRRRVRALPQPRGVHAREPLIQSIILSDPNLLLGAFTDLNINVGHVDSLLPLTTVYTSLPRQKFGRVLGTGLATNFAISRLEHDGRTWFYVANPGYWTMPGTVTVQTTGDIHAVENDTLISDGRSGRHVLELSVPPYSLQAFYVSSPGARIDGFTTGSIAVEDEAHMRKLIADARALLPDPPAAETERFVVGHLQQAEAALDAGQYARAWALLTHHRFWTWKFRAERPGIEILLPMWRGTDQ